MPDNQNNIELSKTKEVHSFIVKTSIGYEKIVADAINHRSKNEKVIVSVLFPERLRGYLFVEATSEDNLKRIVKTMTGVRKVLHGELPFEGIESFFKLKPFVLTLNEGDIVNVVSPLFKNEKARIIRVNNEKEEVIVELLNVAIPVPITMKADYVRVIEKSKEVNVKKIKI